MEITFPPSCNWFLPKIIDVKKDTLVFGYKGDIIICNLKSDDLSLRTAPCIINSIKFASREKITIVLIAPGNTKNEQFKSSVVSTGIDNIVKLWDLTSLSSLQLHKSHESSEIVDVDWSKADPDYIMSIDTSNKLVVWNIALNTVQCFTLKKGIPTCLACCPFNQELVAIGYQTKSTVIYSVRGVGQVMYYLHGHESEVTSLAWCPVPYNIFTKGEQEDQTNTNRDMLLASAGKDKKIYIWKAGCDNNYELVITTPTTLSDSTAQRTQAGSMPSYITTVLWPEPEILLSSTPWNELLSWKLMELWKSRVEEKNRTPKTKGKYTVLHAAHSRFIFSAVCTSRVETEESVLQQGTIETSHPAESERRLVWTTSQDRFMIGADIFTGKICVKFPTFGGAVNCIEYSVTDQTRVALGGGDSAIRIWNVSKDKEYNFVPFWRLRGKVVCLSWHPMEDDLLAFGTDEGSVGLLEVSSINKAPFLYRTSHKKAVHTVSWGPITYPKGHTPKSKIFTLYSSGSGSVYEHVTSEPDDGLELSNFVSIALKANSSSSKLMNIRWKLDYEMLAVGYEAGNICIFDSPHLNLLYSVYPFKKPIYYLIWHPEFTTFEENLSECRHMLAVSSSDISIQIMNFANCIKGKEQKPKLIILNGHRKKILCLSWNPHSCGQLVSSSADGTVRVWDVQKPSILAILTLPDRVLCSVWNPFETDVIISSTAATTVIVWHVSSQKLDDENAKTLNIEENVMKPENRNNKNGCLAKLVDSTAEHTNGTVIEGNQNGIHNGVQQHTESVIEETEELSSEEMSEEDVEENAVEPDTDRDENCAQLATKEHQAATNRESGNKQYKQQSRMYFPALVNRPESPFYFLDAALAIMADNNKYNENEIKLLSDEKLHRNIDFLVDYSSSHEKFGSGVEDIQKAERIESTQFLFFRKNDITDMLKEAARKKKLTPELVVLSPRVSFKFYQEMCYAYGQQLLATGNLFKAVHYILAAGKFHDAVNILKDAHLFREAVYIGKAHLAAHDSVLRDVYTKWAYQVEKSGNDFYLAGLLHVQLNQYDKAAIFFSKTGSLKALYVAMKAAQVAGSIDNAKRYCFDGFRLGLKNQKWQLPEEMLAEFPEMKTYEICFIMHREICSHIKRIYAKNIPWNWLKGNSSGNMKDVLETVNSKWKCDDRRAAYLTISDNFSTALTTGTASVGEMWLNLSMQLVLSLICEETEQKLRHIILALNNVYQWDIHHPEKSCLLLVCYLLSPSGFSAEGCLFAKTNCDINTSSLYKSIRAYFASGLVFAVENLLKQKGLSSEVSEKNESDEETDLHDEQWDLIFSILNTYKEDILDVDTMDYQRSEILKAKLTAKMSRQKCPEKAEPVLASVTDVPNNTLYENDLSKSGMLVLSKESTYMDEKTEAETSDGRKKDIEVKSIHVDINSCVQKTHSVQNDEEKSYMNVNGSVQNLATVDSIVTGEKQIELNVNDSLQIITEQILKLEPEDCDDLNITKQKLACLEEKCKVYIKERISAPNLVFTLSKIRKICDSCIKINGSETAKDLLAECDSLWNRCVN